MIYGSLEPYGVDLSSMKPKPKVAPVKKFYNTPDHFQYGEKDFSYNHQTTGSNKMSNIFSLQERTSAEMRKKQREAEETGLHIIF